MLGGKTFAFAALIATMSFASSPLFAQAPQPAGDVEAAKHAFEDGVVLEKKNDYTGALAKFRESAQIKATLGNRFHIAYCLEMTGLLASALSEYEAVDKAAREQKKTELVDATRVRLDPLRPRVPRVTFHIVPPPPKEGIAGLEVLIDGTPKPPDAETINVDPGDRMVTAHAPDHESFSKKVTIAEGSMTSVDINLPLRAAAAPATTQLSSPGPPQQTSPSPTSDGHSRTYAIAATAGAVAVTAVGVVSFIVAGSAQSDAQTSCLAKTSCSDEQSKVRTFDTVALVGFIGGAGLAALSVVLWLRPSSASSSSSSPGATAPPAAAVGIAARPSWLGVEGRF